MRPSRLLRQILQHALDNDVHRLDALNPENSLRHHSLANPDPIQSLRVNYRPRADRLASLAQGAASARQAREGRDRDWGCSRDRGGWCLCLPCREAVSTEESRGTESSGARYWERNLFGGLSWADGPWGRRGAGGGFRSAACIYRTREQIETLEVMSIRRSIQVGYSDYLT